MLLSFIPPPPATNNSAERAVDWIFSHADDLTSEPMDTDQGEAAVAGECVW